jgi:hypothetical protein
MVAMVETREPGHETTRLGLRCRSLAGEGAVRVVEKAIECVGGAFY